MREYEVFYGHDEYHARHWDAARVDEDISGNTFEEFTKEFLTIILEQYRREVIKLDFKEATRKMQLPKDAKVALEKIVSLHNRVSPSG